MARSTSLEPSARIEAERMRLAEHDHDGLAVLVLDARTNKRGLAIFEAEQDGPRA